MVNEERGRGDGKCNVTHLPRQCLLVLMASML